MIPANAQQIRVRQPISGLRNLFPPHLHGHSRVRDLAGFFSTTMEDERCFPPGNELFEDFREVLADSLECSPADRTKSKYQ
mmetsp:Transcript_22761/g.91183  ORF Transcript_22761/g.91183 Transcript_22761/m.91183 type:complete len:81 (-) Transcript_22761:3231-3473(-)